MKSMTSQYLEVTFRKGKPLAAYLYLPRKKGDQSARSEKFSEGLVIDFAADGRAIGVEIVSPSALTLDGLNAALAHVSVEAITAAELAPLKRVA